MHSTLNNTWCLFFSVAFYLCSLPATATPPLYFGSPDENFTEYHQMLQGYCFASCTGLNCRPYGVMPQTLTSAMNARNGECYLLAEPHCDSLFRDGPGMTLFLINATDEAVTFGAQDNRLSIVQEALVEDGVWRPVEYLSSSWCGNSYHRVTLGPDQYWEFPAPRYRGEFKTKLRFRFYYHTSQMNINEGKVELKSQKHELLSNEFDGSINLSQLSEREAQFPRILMESASTDPFDESPQFHSLDEPKLIDSIVEPPLNYSSGVPLFDHAVLWNPAPASDPTDSRYDLAPSILWEVPIDFAPSDDRYAPYKPMVPYFSAIDSFVNRWEPSVSIYTDSTSVHSTNCARYSFSWEENRAVRGRKSSMQTRMVRITTRSPGQPMTYEVIEPLGVDLIYVSASLEAAASREFGDPISNRKYSSEKKKCLSPNTWVAGVVDDYRPRTGPLVCINRNGEFVALMNRDNPPAQNILHTCVYYFKEGNASGMNQLVVEGLSDLASSDHDGISPYVYRPLEERLRIPPDFACNPK